MKKVGIITFHASHNCGSMLQAYALQQKIFEFGYTNEIINYINKGSKRFYSVTPPICRNGIPRPRLLLAWLKTLPYVNLIKEHTQYYNDFLQNYFVLSSKEYSNSKELSKANFDYTHYIAGSDQVWNIKCIDAGDAYYLDFVKKGKKIAYATSLGATIIKDYAKDISVYRKLISSFDRISVREKNAISQIEELGGKNVEMLIDPTLLYTKEEWSKMLPIGDRLIKEDYIFYYAFTYSDEVNKTVLEISKRYNLPVYIMDARAWGPKNVKKWGFKLTKESGPISFLNFMKYSTLSLTTSFHGTVFSVIFEKPFWYIDSSMHSKNDDRASSLMKQLQIEDRMKFGKEILSKEPLSMWNIDKVSKVLDGLRKEANNFILQSLL